MNYTVHKKYWEGGTCPLGYGVGMNRVIFPDIQHLMITKTTFIYVFM